METPGQLSEAEASRELALREIGETMLMVEAAVSRADRALKVLDQQSGSDPQHHAALVRARRDLEATRRRLHQEAYLYADLLPLE
ncbi:MAG: hypothetical protein ACRENX_11325 [Candidatus Dormibacteria bacterium]